MKKSILVVDDDPKFLRLIVPTLEERGYQIIKALNASEASIELGLKSFDLIIVDGELPTIDGLTWITEIRKAGINVPIVFVTAHWRDTTSFCKLKFELNVALILHKPISRAIFAEQIGELLGDDRKISTAEEQGFDELLNQLREQFLTELPETIGAVATAVSLAKRQPDDRSLFETALLKAHTLNGTAGSCGFPEVGKLMRKVEYSLRAIMANPGDFWSPDLWCLIDTSLVQAATIVQEFRSNQEKNTKVASHNSLSSAKRILILDDCRTFTRRAEALLSAEDFLVYSFSDVKLVAETMEYIQPQLLILNISMAEVDVLEICSQLRRRRCWMNLPILFVYEPHDQARRNEAIAAGGNGVLPKNAPNTDFVGLVTSYLSPTRANRSAA